jgi:hypothetical protein
MEDLSEMRYVRPSSAQPTRHSAREKWFLYYPFFGMYAAFAVYFYFSVIQPYLASRDYYGPRLLADAITYEAICVIERDFLDFATLRDIGPCLGLWTFSYDSGLLSIVNATLIVTSILWLAKVYERPWQPMLTLALINPITFSSIFGANKEVFAFVSFAMLAVFVRSRSLLSFSICLVTALFTRIPALITIGAFCFILMAVLPRTGAVFGKMRRFYLLLIMAVVVACSLIAAIYGQQLQDNLLGDFSRAEDVSRSTDISLSMNSISGVGLYPLVYITRIILNLYSGVIGFTNLLRGEGANYYTVAVSGSSLIFIYLTIRLFWKGISKDLSGTATSWNIGFFLVLMTSSLCLSPVIQHRYFFGIYVIIVLFSIRKEEPAYKHALSVDLATAGDRG